MSYSLQTRKVLAGLVGTLVVILLCQASWLVYVRHQRIAAATDPLLPGQDLQTALFHLGGEPFKQPAGCWHAYIGTATCPYCRDLATRWQQDSMRHSGYWIIVDDTTASRAFADEFGLPSDSVLIAGSGTTLQDMRVFATPTRVTLRGRSVLDLRIAGEPLTRAEADSTCRLRP